MKTYHDIIGDGGSGVSQQVRAQRTRIATALSGVRYRLAIGSGKGGVGKSTLTFHLAEALRARGLDVALLDADLNGPSLARLAGVGNIAPLPGASGALLPKTKSGVTVFSMGSVLPQDGSLEFDSVARGDSHTWRATREFALLTEVMGAIEWGRRDLLLVDLPPGADRTVQYAEFLGSEFAFLLVTVPSELSREVVRRSVTALTRTSNRVLGYVENMSGYYCVDCKKVKPLFPSSAEVDLGTPKIGSVPFDPELARLCDAGRSLAEGSDSPVALAMNQIAEKVIRSLEALP